MYRDSYTVDGDDWVHVISSYLPQFEADRRAFIITINSFGTALNRDDRNKLYPSIGMLDPESLAKLARASDYDEVRQVADTYSVS